MSEFHCSLDAPPVASRLCAYSLAIMPPPQIAEEVCDFKQLFRDATGKSYGSANADGHISLDGFDAAEVDYPLILAEYKRLITPLTPFQLNFSGFADFDRANFSAFYIKPTEDSCNAIRERTQAVMKGFDKKFKKQYMQKWADESKNPHMTIGRRLTREWVALAHSLFKEYEAGFVCDSFAIRKYNEKRRQYEVIDTILLSGQKPVGEQISLF
ncbi:2'-5' RNA ligase superfamily protein [Dyadobacter soli]|uniref:2'-5' RNA ligase superfamily protein n=1 Tax=Dyadobacter soli TaxID=659014 RepID=A0A1G6XZ08_9BACT|nr:2'-5' RNA ligase family protein [Dyadobacter soli]SDD83408.1 2'-5' RNA ligase superfamily protein [Dyadobacter soli]